MENFIDPLFYLDGNYVYKFIDLYNKWMTEDSSDNFNKFINYYRKHKKDLARCIIFLYDNDCVGLPIDSLLSRVFSDERKLYASIRMRTFHAAHGINAGWYAFLKEIYSKL